MFEQLINQPDLQEAAIQEISFQHELHCAFDALEKEGLGADAHPELYLAIINQARYAERLSQAFIRLTKANNEYDTPSVLEKPTFKYSGFTFKPIRVCQAFIRLIKRNITPDTPNVLYHAIIQNAFHADSLSKSFVLLNQQDIPFEDNQALYEAIFRRPDLAEKLSNAFIGLTQEGIIFKKNTWLYEAIINHADDGENLSLVFIALRQQGITFRKNKVLYEAITKKEFYWKDLLLAFIALSQQGLTFKKNKILYNAIVKGVCHEPKLSDAFIALSQNGFTLKKNKVVYEAIIETPYFAAELSQAFNILKNQDILPETHSLLYKIIIYNKYYADTMPLSLVKLKQQGITFETHPQIYHSLFNTQLDEYADELVQGIISLNQHNITPDKHTNLYKLLFENCEHTNRLINISIVYDQLGITVETHPNFYKLILETNVYFSTNQLTELLTLLGTHGASPEKHEALYLLCLEHLDELHVICPTMKELDSYHLPKDIFLTYFRLSFKNPDLTQSILNDLADAGLTYEDYPFIYEAISTLFENNLQLTIHLLKALCTHAKENHTKPSSPHRLSRRKQALLQIVEEQLKPNITFGPLNKAKETKLLEALLQHIVDTPTEDISMSFDDSVGYTLSFTRFNTTIQLTQLVNHSNLSHLKLSERLLSELGEKMKALAEVKSFPESSNRAVAQLPEPLQAAICYYTSRKYKNINRLLRGEKLDENDFYKWLFSSVTGTKNLLLNFITGILVNVASNKLIILSRRTEPTATPKEQYKLDRGEILSPELEKRRMTNVQASTTVTSYSIRKKGSPYFHHEGTIRTTMQGDFSSYPVMNEREGEVLIPGGQQIQYARDKQGFFATLVCSPKYESNKSYWSALALTHAYDKHLHSPYKLSNHHINLNQKQIERPNHGLAHTFRVMENINVVINYYAHHALSPNFKHFCQSLSPNDIDALRVAAAFSITGRENEMSAGENLKLYDSFREASMIHLQLFLSQHPMPYEANLSKALLFDIVRFMGNPNYENALNKHHDPRERAVRNFTHRILTLAHKLDLTRCYAPEQFDKSMASCRELSISSSEQKAAYDNMIRYNIELSKAHGNCLKTDIDCNGMLIPASLRYSTPFDEASSSVTRLNNISDTVPKPDITEAYQFDPFKTRKTSRV